MDSFQAVLGKTKCMEFPVGENKDGTIIKADLSQINHLLVAGATGTGKSVFVDTMLLTLISHNTTNNLQMILCDTKASEFHLYNNIEHLLVPVCSDGGKVGDILQWALAEGRKRLQVFSENTVKNMVAFNDRAWESFSSEMPHLLIVIDDFSSLLCSRPDLSDIIMQLLSIGRTVGIHIVGVTQTPSVKQVKPFASIFTSRIVFQSLPSDLRFVTGKRNPQPLINTGDAWYCSMGSQILVHSILPGRTESFDILEAAISASKMKKDVTAKLGEETFPFTAGEFDKTGMDEGKEDELLPDAMEVILSTGQASVSMLQRKLKLGYSRAAKIIDQIEQRGYVGPFEGGKPRAVLVTRSVWAEIKATCYNSKR